MPSAFDLLRVQFERLRASRFSSIKAADVRLGGTFVLFGVTLGAGVMLALTPPSAHRETAAAEPAAVDRWVGRQKESAPVGSVKIVDAGPRREIPCAEQTWPYIDRRCLTVAEPKSSKPPAETTGAGSAEITPVTATVAAPKLPSEAREQTALAATAPAEQDSARAQVAVPQPRPRIEAAIKPAAPEQPNVKSEATPTPVAHQEEKSAPAATPATPTTPALATQQPIKRVAKLTDKVGPAVALAIAPAKRAAPSKPVDAKPRIVSRWTEKVYHLGDGRTHRVITVRQGSGPAGYNGARRAWSAYAAESDDD